MPGNDPLDAARNNLAHYMALVHETDMRDVWGGQAVPAAHHMDMIRALSDPELGHTLMVMPRGAGKTTLVQGWLEWLIGRASMGPKNWANDIRIIYFSNTAHQAYRVSNAVKATIEGNQLFQAVFPKVKKHPDKWSEAEWKLRGNTIKDSNFMAIGVGGPALGARATVMVFDDIGDQENMASLKQRTDLVEWLDNTAMPILVPWGRVVMPCTRWAWDDPAHWAMERNWHTIYMKALEEKSDDRHHSGDISATAEELVRAGNAGHGGQVEAGNGDSRFQSYWPERFPVAKLLELKKESPRAFAKQYQNEVAPEEGLIFERVWFEARFDREPTDNALRVDSWDTAAGQGRNRSYSAGLSVAVTGDWHVYILHLLRGQLAYSDLREAVHSVAQRNRSNAVIIEKKSSGHALVQDSWLNHIPIVEWQPFGQKGSPTRMEANERVSAICAQGRVHLPTDYFCRQHGSTGWIADFEQEVFSYPDSQHDDIVDALCQLLFWVEEQRLKHVRLLQMPREPVPWALSQSEGERRLVV